MQSLNRVSIIGNVVARPELRYTPNGSPVAEVRVAMNEKSTVRGAEKERTTFIDVTVWGRDAESAAEMIDKGSPVFIDGRLDVEEWTDHETNKRRTKMKVTARMIQLLFVTRRQDRATAAPATTEQSGTQEPIF